MEYDQLLFFAALDDFGGSSVEFCFDLVDDWNYEWRKQRKDEHVQLVCVLLVLNSMMGMNQTSQGTWAMPDL